MKKLLSLSVLFSVILLTLASCGGGDDPMTPEEKTEAEKRAEILTTKAFTLQNVTPPPNGGDPDGWDNLTLTFGSITDDGINLTVAGAKADFGEVWTNGSTDFTWTSDAGTSVTRQDGQVITVSAISETELTLQFTVASATARTTVIDGPWVFTFNVPTN